MTDQELHDLKERIDAAREEVVNEYGVFDDYQYCADCDALFIRRRADAYEGELSFHEEHDEHTVLRGLRHECHDLREWQRCLEYAIDEMS